MFLPMEPAQSVPQTLHAAADAIETHGHTKGILLDEHGGMCANGAILRALDVEMIDHGHGTEVIGLHHKRPHFKAAVAALGSYLDLSDNPYKASDLIPRWNNAPERTAQDVVEALRAAAAIEQAKLDTQTPAETEVPA
jgi:hypothetical protein